jgi:hypothetical protein
VIFSIKEIKEDKYSMTKKLEEIFNLDEAEKSAKKSIPVKPEPEDVKSIDDTYRAVEAMTRDLPAIKELDNLDEVELDHLAKKAEEAYDNLMDLGMNVEVRYSSRLFEVASSMMKNAIDAKTAKIDRKLKAVDLQLKKYKIDKDNNEDPNNIMNGEGYVITDRNELLKKLTQKS